jgi:hypothetical protein
MRLVAVEELAVEMGYSRQSQGCNEAILDKQSAICKQHVRVKEA